MRIAGTLTNLSGDSMTDIQIETAAGNCRIDQSLAGGASVKVDRELTNQAISFSGLPEDVGDISPQRADRMDELVKAGMACVECQMADGTGMKVIPGVDADQHWQVVRAAVELAR
jgi:copper chaperone CopZ